MQLSRPLLGPLPSQNNKAYPLNNEQTSQNTCVPCTWTPLNARPPGHDDDDEPRLRELREAARLEPDWIEPACASAKLSSIAAIALRLCVVGACPKRTIAVDRSLRGRFRLLTNQPEQAEETLCDSFYWNMSEVLHSLAIAPRTVTEDLNSELPRSIPDEDDSNLGLIAVRQDNFAAAVTLFREACKREPDITEGHARCLTPHSQKTGKKRS